jgi:hypothetical protein
MLFALLPPNQTKNNQKNNTLYIIIISVWSVINEITDDTDY